MTRTYIQQFFRECVQFSVQLTSAFWSLSKTIEVEYGLSKNLQILTERAKKNSGSPGENFFFSPQVRAVNRSIFLGLISVIYRMKYFFVVVVLSQTAFTCSKLTIETLEQGVNMFKVNNKDTRTTPLSSLWYLYC